MGKLTMSMAICKFANCYQRVSFYSIPALLETGGLVLDPFILGLPMAAFVFDIGGK
jgi:hypothetical protein